MFRSVLALSQRKEHDAQIQLDGRPIARHALASVYLQRKPQGIGCLQQVFRSALALAEHLQRHALIYLDLGPCEWRPIAGEFREIIAAREIIREREIIPEREIMAQRKQLFLER